MILVVGAEGLIGAALLEEVRRSGRDALGTSRNPKPGLLTLDLNVPEKFEPPAGVSCAVICAGRSGLLDCDRSPQETAKVNVQGTMRICEKLTRQGIPVVFLSSSLVFGGLFEPAGPWDETAPCCEYARQKAMVEKSMVGDLFAVVRITKVVEALRPRFSDWLQNLRLGRKVLASTVIRFSPVVLGEVARALADLSGNFHPGRFHISGDAEVSYLFAAQKLAEKADLPLDLVIADSVSGTKLFETLPRSSMMKIAGPAGSSDWRFTPSLPNLEAFLIRQATEQKS